ncbi:hypothetical protein BH11MYX3_BH11MYX3_08540 [soil metagenome]
MADSRSLLRPAQLLALVKELRKVEGGAAPVEPEQQLELRDAQELHERSHHSGSILGG